MNIKDKLMNLFKKRKSNIRVFALEQLLGAAYDNKLIVKKRVVQEGKITYDYSPDVIYDLIAMLSKLDDKALVHISNKENFDVWIGDAIQLEVCFVKYANGIYTY